MINSGLMIAGALLCLLFTLPFCKTLRGERKKKNSCLKKNEVNIKNIGQAKSKATWLCLRLPDCHIFIVY